MKRWTGYWGICYDLYIDTFISETDPRRSDTHTTVYLYHSVLTYQ
jgi:uncharacterized protein Veg